MNFKNIAAIATISLLAFQSCTKEEVKTTDASIENNMDEDLSTITPSAVVVADSTAALKTFSILESKDIELQKEAITLNSVKEGDEEKAYLLFNADQSKAEVFMPTESKGVIFERKGTEGNYTWTDRKYELIQWKGYVLRTLKQGTPLFGGDVM